MAKSKSKPEEYFHAGGGFRAAALAGVFLVFFILSAPMAFAALPGDVNDDGKLNVVDLQCVVLVTLNLDPDNPPACMGGSPDLNCDDGTNIVDVQLVARMSLAKLHGLTGIPLGKDYDQDNVHNGCDICPHQWNPYQADNDDDGVGDACDPTPDGGDSGNLCEGVECDPGAGWGCVVSSCNELTGACEPWPAHGSCGDDTICTTDWCDYETGECRHDPSGLKNCDPQGIQAGDLLVTEFLANPSGTDDGQEYLELFNTSQMAISLKGFELTDDDSDVWLIDQSVVVEPGSFVVLGSTDSDGLRTGHPVDYLYPRSEFTLAQGSTGDEIVLVYDEIEIDAVRYTSGWDIVSGKALSLSSGAFSTGENDDPSMWCLAQSSVPNSPSEDLGTPGAENAYCEVP